MMQINMEVAATSIVILAAPGGLLFNSAKWKLCTKPRQVSLAKFHSFHHPTTSTLLELSPLRFDIPQLPRTLNNYKYN